MAACGSLQLMLDKPLPENPTLLESLCSWNQRKSANPIEDHSSSFTEIFGELHFKENPEALLPSFSSSTHHHIKPEDKEIKNEGIIRNTKCPSSSPSQYHRNSDSFSSMNSESLQLCTERLGFESFDDVEDLKVEPNGDWQNQEEKTKITKVQPALGMMRDESSSFLRSKITSGGGEFPPPISCIGKSGRPWVRFHSYREDGRFVLTEIRIPTEEFLHASREDGRLRLKIYHSEDEEGEMLEEEEEEEEDAENTQMTTINLVEDDT